MHYSKHQMMDKTKLELIRQGTQIIDITNKIKNESGNGRNTVELRKAKCSKEISEWYPKDRKRTSAKHL